jgi:hypothetical protein
MEAVWLPHPLPSLVVVAPDGAAAGLRGMRQRMADAMRDDEEVKVTLQKGY